MNRIKAILLPLIVITFLIIPFITASAGTVQLPQTGQTKCYDEAGTEIACAGTGQDGEIQAGVHWPNPRFTDNGDGTVTDNLTGLMWLKSPDSTTRTWYDTINYFDGLNFAGHSDWRLPNVKELESLINVDESNNASWLNTQGFSNVPSLFYWSSSTNKGYTNYAWYVSMGNGGVGDVGKFYSKYVWPVRAGQCGSFGNSVICLPQTGQTTSYRTGDDGDLETGVAWPSPRFTDNNDGTVTDNLTGLMWTKDANLNGYKTWQASLIYCNNLNYAGHSDWRLSNRKELGSLLDYSQYANTLQQGHPFTNVQSNYYWSSSTDADSTSRAWGVDMGTGIVYDFNKGDVEYVWPVRGGLVGEFVPSVISVSPNSGVQGETLDVSISGTNFTGAESVEFDTGLTVITYTVISDTVITANITISSSATPGTMDVSVTAPDGTGTATGGFTVTELVCTYTISPASNSFDSTGGTGTVSITTSDDCDWTAVSNDSWLTIDSSSTGTGNGVITYTVAANTSADTITGTITIADKTFTVTQSGDTPDTKLPDLKANSVKCPKKIKRKKKLSIKAVIKNIGKKKASSTSAQFYLSTNNDISTTDGDKRLTTKSVKSLKKKKSQIVKYKWKVRAKRGAYYIKVLCDSDNAVSESNEDNNIKVSRKVTVR